MFTKVLRKSAILLIFYAIIIIGIFVIQFKNDSIISEKIGNLHITLTESVSEDNKTTLKNKMNVVSNGITFFVNDENPAKIVINGTERNVNLVSWKKDSALSCVFNFSENVLLRFSVNDESQNALLNIETDLPFGATSFSIPYVLSGGSTIAEESQTRIQINNKKNTWVLAAAEIEDNRIFMTNRNSVVSYAFFDKTKVFSFDLVKDFTSASEQSYRATISSLENNFIAAFEKNLSLDSANITEQEAVSYVAIKAARRQYSDAVDMIPTTFKRGSGRTYLSAPYFDNLAQLNESLVRQQQAFSDMILLATQNGSLNVFNVKNLSDYMSFHPGSESINQLIENTASRDLSGISVLNAAGIISVYVELYEKNKTLADKLQNAIPSCVKKIEESCNLDNENLNIVENGTFLSVIQGTQIGDALLRYGTLSGNSDYMNAGRLLINSYLKDNISFDSRALAELYPLVVHNNTYYPHYVLMGFDSNGAVWAYTCAEDITYSSETAGEISINITFPISYTHYVIVNGINAFRQIYIYGMPFRTDPRFETYNSSGYVFQRDNRTLLLKSRHRERNEIVRLIYRAAETQTQNSANDSETNSTSSETNLENSEISSNTENETLTLGM